MYAIDLPQIRARIRRLRKLAEALGKEVTAWKDRQGPLLPGEQRRYLNAMHGAIKGLDDARHALAVAVKRLDRDRLDRERR
ncbi:MAG TPA: hypothetical protein VMS17_01440 [Gemmataceae bacterium]|nr:hypothetical protein [Gemmataceae bacterium]